MEGRVMANKYTHTGSKKTKYGGKKISGRKKKSTGGGNSHLSGQARKAEEALHKSSKKAEKY
jgi:hypothetical protein